MHGIVAWDANINPVTNLVTWEDSRISPTDCQQLAVPQIINENIKKLRISPGYGCATLLWWRKNTPEIIRTAVSCGSIMDLFVARLTKNPKVKISPQIAHSFGCWNMKENWLILDPLLPSVDNDCQILNVVDTRFSQKCKTIAALGEGYIK